MNIRKLPVRRLGRKLQDEKGLSLLELLTAVLITTMVSIILYSFLLMGVSMYKRIMVETQMRNQGDALYRQIMAELKDAVYVEQRSAAGLPANTSIRYVKRAEDADTYINEYVMTLEAGEHNGVLRVYKNGNASASILELKMTPAFTISAGSLTAIGHNRVNVSLTYKRSNDGQYVQADRTELKMNSQITLFRFN